MDILMKGVKIILYIICVFQMNYASAQYGKEGQELLCRFERRFSELDSLIYPVQRNLSGTQGGLCPAAVRFSSEPDSGLFSALDKEWTQK